MRRVRRVMRSVKCWSRGACARLRARMHRKQCTPYACRGSAWVQPCAACPAKCGIKALGHPAHRKLHAFAHNVQKCAVACALQLTCNLPLNCGPSTTEQRMCKCRWRAQEICVAILQQHPPHHADRQCIEKVTFMLTSRMHNLKAASKCFTSTPLPGRAGTATRHAASYRSNINPTRT